MGQTKGHKDGSNCQNPRGHGWDAFAMGAFGIESDIVVANSNAAYNSWFAPFFFSTNGIFCDCNCFVSWDMAFCDAKSLPIEFLVLNVGHTFIIRN